MTDESVIDQALSAVFKQLLSDLLHGGWLT